MMAIELTALIIAAGLLARQILTLRRSLHAAESENAALRAEVGRVSRALGTLQYEHIELTAKCFAQAEELSFYHAEDEAKGRAWTVGGERRAS